MKKALIEISVSIIVIGLFITVSIGYLWLARQLIIPIENDWLKAVASIWAIVIYGAPIGWVLGEAIEADLKRKRERNS